MPDKAYTIGNLAIVGAGILGGWGTLGAIVLVGGAIGISCCAIDRLSMLKSVRSSCNPC